MPQTVNPGAALTNGMRRRAQQVSALMTPPPSGPVAGAPSVSYNPGQGIPPLLGRPTPRAGVYAPDPRLGPVPKMSQGTGATGQPVMQAHAGAEPAGYLARRDYQPTGMTYDPQVQERFSRQPPTSVNLGQDGVSLVSTYRTHDSTVARYTQTQWRSAPMWEQLTTSVVWRKLLVWQQVARYNLFNEIALARPLDPNQYFLGYAQNPSGAALYGGGPQQKPLGS